MRVGIAGIDEMRRITQAQGAAAATGTPLVAGSQRLGDRAANRAWDKAVWFADFTYVVKPGHSGVTWREGRETVFSPINRTAPLYIDSSYRRFTGTAPLWSQAFGLYPAAIELCQPDGYAAWDYPDDRARSLAALRELTAIFPGDVTNGRMWPVFSIRWAWDDHAHLDFARLPATKWGSGRNSASLIPLTRTQRGYSAETKERWARQALANAAIVAADADFRRMADTFGRVMIGGMVNGPCPRIARHIFAAALCDMLPGVQFWLLGQANFAVVNGLGMLGLLDRVCTDGSWWIREAASERLAYVENGLITIHSFEAELGRDQLKRVKNRQSFFTTGELMAASLRSLLAAYQGLWAWPPPSPLPVDMSDPAQAIELKARYQSAQLELGL